MRRIFEAHRLVLSSLLFEIRVPKNDPVLYTAIAEDVPGDKDFAESQLERPEIYTPAEFIHDYGIH